MMGVMSHTHTMFRFEHRFEKGGVVQVHRVTFDPEGNPQREAWVIVRPSNIPNAGLGVFALKNFKKGDAMGYYSGAVLVDPKKTKRRGNYAMEVQGGQVILDGACLFSFPTMINDIRDTKRYNVRVDETALLRASANISEGEELYLDYGPSFWATRSSAR
jgi:hypothetical protein